MTVRINKPALNLREELTKAQGVVRYEQRQFWMDGLVENGTFDTDISGWNFAPNGSVVTTWQNGEIRVENGANTVGQTSAVISVQSGKTYRATFEVTAINGVQAQLYLTTDGSYFTEVAGAKYSSAGTYSFTYTASETRDLYVTLGHRGNNTAGLYAQYDNIQIFEVDENDNVIHSVPLGFKPVHVYEDGLLQREGTNHDYTVVDTGFGYQVKPTVAPSATTETCIIAEREL